MSSSSIVSAGPADLDIPGGTCYFQVNGPHCPAVLHNKTTNCLFIVYYLCAVAYNGELYIFGGYNARLDRHFNDLWKFNPGEVGKNLELP